MKKALIALMLVLLVQGKAVNAQIAQTDPSTLSPAITNALAASNVIPAPVEPEPAPTVQDVLLAVCVSEGYGQDCAQHLLGMLWNESNNISTAIGDRGKARGYFQIWVKLHKITVACAEDLVCSAKWTIRYMERNAYPKYVSYAVQCHNGCNINNGYAAKAFRNGKRLWNTPLEVKQAAPIVLPEVDTLALAK